MSVSVRVKTTTIQATKIQAPSERLNDARERQIMKIVKILG